MNLLNITEKEDSVYIYYNDLEKKEGERYQFIQKNNVQYSTHSPSCDKLFNVLSNLNIKESDSILDIGCGKGYALFICSLFPFCKIDGVEICKESFEICKENTKKLNLENRIQLHLKSITEMKNLNEYNYFYLYNPFKEDIFEKFLEKINDLRDIYIIYKNIHKEDMKILEKYNFEKKTEIKGNDRNYFIFYK